MSDDKKNFGQIRFDEQVAPDACVVSHRHNGETRTLMAHPASDGKPIPPGGEVMHIDPSCDDGWHNVTFHHRNGPAQVATPAYRDGYDRIFGKKQTVGEA